MLKIPAWLSAAFALLAIVGSVACSSGEGAPLVAGGKVEGKVTAQRRAKKIEVQKFKRRTTYKRRHGHRQLFTEVEITAIKGA